MKNVPRKLVDVVRNAVCGCTVLTDGYLKRHQTLFLISRNLTHFYMCFVL